MSTTEDLVLAAAIATAVACGPTRPTPMPPQTAASLVSSPDGGSPFEDALPAIPPTGKSVIVPGDRATGDMGGSAPGGTGTSTGTNGRALGPGLGNPAGGGN